MSERKYPISEKSLRRFRSTERRRREKSIQRIGQAKKHQAQASAIAELNLSIARSSLALREADELLREDHG